MLMGWGTVNSVSAKEETPVIQFSIKPRLCVLSEGEEVCHDELEIKWISQNQRTLCLYQSDTGKQLRCWDNTFSGVHYVEVIASENIDFYLKENADEKPVISEVFEVVQDNTKYRRRRRNGWNFF
ncbi:hypothetical protein TDB9533_01940 [Thalassocella blandensis]|nr:hypothetical protein TDB9533_01940 [Thalassocella blandensis]